MVIRSLDGGAYFDRFPLTRCPLANLRAVSLPTIDRNIYFLDAFGWITPSDQPSHVAIATFTVRKTPEEANFFLDEVLLSNWHLSVFPKHSNPNKEEGKLEIGEVPRFCSSDALFAHITTRLHGFPQFSSSSYIMADKKEKFSIKVIDAESSSGSTDGDGRLVRQLKNRHMAMISIGGVIGTGLFLGTSSALVHGGPLGLLLGYVAMGTVCYCVMVSLGEMVAFLPIEGGHIKLAERFVGPAFSFTMGWNYWYNWVIVLPAELSVPAVFISFWDKTINPAVWVGLFWVTIVCINLLGAAAYGEAEFISVSIKIITITGLIILGVILDLGGGPDHDRIEFRYWKNPGPFVQYSGIEGAKGRFLGFWAVLTQAAFSYIGAEIVATAAAEAKNPRRSLPRAIKLVYISILIFYTLGTFVIGLLVPSDDPALSDTTRKGTAAASPFVIAMSRSGIKGLPSVINACLLVSAVSAASSDLYTSSRALYGLAVSGNAPKVFLRTSRSGLPYVSVIVCSLFALLAFMAVSAGAANVFNWFANMTAIAGLMSWFGISLTYLRFYAGLKAQKINREELHFYSNLQPFAAWYAMIASLLVCLFSGWSVFLKGNLDTADFITNYLPLAMFPVMYIIAKFIYREPHKKPEEMDFVTNIKEIEAATYDDPPPRNKVEALWARLI